MERINGVPANNWLIKVLQDRSQSSADPIAIDWHVPFPMTMLQLTAAWNVHPVTQADKFQLWVEYPSATYQNCILREITPADDIDLYFACVVPFYFHKSAHVVVDFPNTDNNDVAVYLHLNQVPASGTMQW